jgi:hypothetical protein
MEAGFETDLSGRFTGLSDRFRSLWTFYQFLGGVFKHQSRGAIPFVYDFQALYRRLQDAMPRTSGAPDPDNARELDQIGRELDRIHDELANIESQFAPSLLRRFFDHLKNQDEKILFALVKFYLLQRQLDRDTLDKLDILLTRMGEISGEEGRAAKRDTTELRSSFSRLAALTPHRNLSDADRDIAVDRINGLRRRVMECTDFQELMDSGLFDTYRDLKNELETSILDPDVAVAVVSANIDMKNTFQLLYTEEETRILEDTNRVFEIVRYLEKNPNLAHEQLRAQIEVFRESRERFDAGRRDHNVKREDIVALKKSMQQVLDAFEPGRSAAATAAAASLEPVPSAPAPAPVPARPTPAQPLVDEPTFAAASPAAPPVPPSFEEAEVVELTPPAIIAPSSGAATPSAPARVAAESQPAAAAITDILPPDPLITESLHKIVFALELVVWDHAPEQAAHAKELHHLRLEPWEVGTFRTLAERHVAEGTIQWSLQLFYLQAAALRVKMDEETAEIRRLAASGKTSRLGEILERSSQSLERAGEIDRRFRWFIDDMLFEGHTGQIEQIYRSHFRFLQAYSTLWLEHQANGGITPL